MQPFSVPFPCRGWGLRQLTLLLVSRAYWSNWKLILVSMLEGANMEGTQKRKRFKVYLSEAERMKAERGAGALSVGIRQALVQAVVIESLELRRLWFQLALLNERLAPISSAASIDPTLADPVDVAALMDDSEKVINRCSALLGRRRRRPRRG